MCIGTTLIRYGEDGVAFTTMVSADVWSVRMFEMIKQTLFVLLMTATTSFAQAAPKDDVNWINVEVVIRGDYFEPPR